MVISPAKLVPRVVAAAVMGYCVWPTLADFISGAQTKPQEALPEVRASLLTPATPSPLTRNPLQKPVVVQAKGDPAKSAKAAGKTGSSAAAKADSKPVDPLSGLMLNAIFSVGQQRLAVINGRSYAAGDKLPVSTAASTALTVGSVLPYSVLLERDGSTLELKYSDTVSSGGSSPAASGAGPSAQKEDPAARNPAMRNPVGAARERSDR